MSLRWKEKSTVERHCETCACVLERNRTPAGRLEGYRDFTRRRFCSLSCANSRSKGGQSRNAYLFRARKFLKASCECCGVTDQRQAHHVDMDWKNNTPDNIQTLCIFCHHFWHAMHIRLGVMPTQRMPKLVFPLPTMPEVGLAGSEPTATPSSRKSRKLSSKPI